MMNEQDMARALKNIFLSSSWTLKPGTRLRIAAPHRLSAGCITDLQNPVKPNSA